MRPVAPLFRAIWLVVLSATIAGHVAAAEIPCPDPPISPPTRAFVQPPRPCPDQDVRILFATCAPCWDIVDVSQGPDGITVWTEQRPDSCIREICMPESASVALGSFAAGHHAVLVRLVTTVVVHGDSDSLIHSDLGRKLYDAAQGRKRFVLVEGGSHFSTMAMGLTKYRAALAELFSPQWTPH